jgi:hypothetical protein
MSKVQIDGSKESQPDRFLRMKSLVKSLNDAMPSTVSAAFDGERVLIQSKLNGKKVWLNGEFRLVGEAG